MHMQKVYLAQNICPSQKFNSKWIIDLNVKCKIMKFPGDAIAGNLGDLGYGEEFGTAMKERIRKLSLVKLKIFCSAEDTVKRMRRQTRVWEKLFAKDVIW